MSLHAGSGGGTATGTNTGDQTITLTGPVTGSGSGSFATTITAKAVTYAKIQDEAATTLLGNPTGGSTAPSEITLGGGLYFSGTALYGPNEHPGYISGNWYSTVRGAAVIAGATFATGTIKLVPFTISRPITPNALGARVTTLAASGNFQLAIYANNAATGRPTGTAIYTTAGISTAATGALSGTATGSGALTPGTYWMAINLDASAGGVAVFQTIGATEILGGYLIGSATLANIASGAGTAQSILSVTQAYNTWPDLTSGSFTEQQTSSSALVYMKAA